MLTRPRVNDALTAFARSVKRPGVDRRGRVYTTRQYTEDDCEKREASLRYRFVDPENFVPALLPPLADALAPKNVSRRSEQNLIVAAISRPCGRNRFTYRFLSPSRLLGPGSRLLPPAYVPIVHPAFRPEIVFRGSR